jgi:predicted RNA-binding Zn-ribbon protein involved in translation (DUF1610 family)
VASRFFCENCGAEVKRDSKTCPQCGKPFSSVKCPACGFTGEEVLFKGGCPVCGYSAGQGGKDPAEKDKKIWYVSADLPVWVYIMTALALAAVLAAIIIRFRA